MLIETNYTVPTSLLQEALDNIPSDDFKLTINEPTGNFFYDPWEIKSEFKDTVWQKLLQSLPTEIGEARIIVLNYGACYQSHSDIDDRYHLNISSHYAYLINLENNVMYPLSADGIWYAMDAGIRHTAANFGYFNRVQLVVRKLLINSLINDPVNIKISYVGFEKDTVRFKFDDKISPWLNRAVKQCVVSNFILKHNDIQFTLEHSSLDALKMILPADFKIELL